MNDPHAIKVILRNQEGNYLAGEFEQDEFTNERAKARVFDCVQDSVRERLDSMRKTRGSAFVAVRVDPREAYEICDQCGRRVMSFRALFDGARFLCDQCAQRHSAATGDPPPCASGPGK
jgi:formylmethanofuran dehydrogenase subunit E